MKYPTRLIRPPHYNTDLSKRLSSNCGTLCRLATKQPSHRTKTVYLSNAYNNSVLVIRSSFVSACVARRLASQHHLAECALHSPRPSLQCQNHRFRCTPLRLMLVFLLLRSVRAMELVFCGPEHVVALAMWPLYIDLRGSKLGTVGPHRVCEDWAAPQRKRSTP